MARVAQFPEENFREAAGDDRADAMAVEGLWGVLPELPQPKFIPETRIEAPSCFGSLSGWGSGAPLERADIIECVFAQSFKGDAFHEPGRDDAVGTQIISGDMRTAVAGDSG